MRAKVQGMLLVGLIAIAGLTNYASAAVVTESSTFSAFSVTYDPNVWGAIKYSYEADSFSGVPPVDQFGFGRFFLDPAFGVSSDPGPLPGELRVSGEIVLTANPGWGLYAASFFHTGRWSTRGSGTVSVEESFVDITAPNAQFFYERHDAFTGPMSFVLPWEQEPGVTTGYYLIVGERSSLGRFDALTIQFDLKFNAAVSDTASSASLASDVSDSYLGSGLYPTTNVIGTGIFVSFERVAPVPEPSTYALMLGGLGLVCCAMRRRRMTGI